LGDERLSISTNERMLLHHLALQKIERTLAQGQPPEEALLAVQRLLEDEAVQPLGLVGTRGARAVHDAALEALQQGKVSINQAWTVLWIGLAGFASNWEESMMRL